MSKLPSRRFHLVFSLLMGAMMIFVMTFVITMVNVGPVPTSSRAGRVRS